MLSYKPVVLVEILNELEIQESIVISCVFIFKVNIVSDNDGFVWKGHEALSVRGGDVTFTSGFQPACVMQLHPPAAATALALHSEWQM